MKIFDCFIFNNENLLTKIRLNTLNNYVDFFVICESGEDHMGRRKNYKFDIDAVEEFKNKIIYLKLDNFPKNFSGWQRQDYQRDFLLKGLSKANDNDIIIFSDADEIPNLSCFSEHYKNKLKDGYVGIFLQYLYYYRLNILTSYENHWEGSRVILKKNLKSFKKLRGVVLKNSFLPFWRFDKFKKSFKIDQGGWHFSYLMTAEEIANKISSSPHQEFNLDKYKNIEQIKNKINNLEDLYERDKKFKKIPMNNTYLPEYILHNKNIFKDWIS